MPGLNRVKRKILFCYKQPKLNCPPRFGVIYVLDYFFFKNCLSTF